MAATVSSSNGDAFVLHGGAVFRDDGAVQIQMMRQATSRRRLYARGLFWVAVCCRTGLVLVVDTEDIHPVFAARPERRRPNLPPTSTPENVRVRTQHRQNNRLQAFGRSWVTGVPGLGCPGRGCDGRVWTSSARRDGRPCRPPHRHDRRRRPPERQHAKRVCVRLLRSFR